MARPLSSIAPETSLPSRTIRKPRVPTPATISVQLSVARSVVTRTSSSSASEACVIRHPRHLAGMFPALRNSPVTSPKICPQPRSNQTVQPVPLALPIPRFIFSFATRRQIRHSPATSSRLRSIRLRSISSSTSTHSASRQVSEQPPSATRNIPTGSILRLRSHTTSI